MDLSNWIIIHIICIYIYISIWIASLQSESIFGSIYLDLHHPKVFDWRNTAPNWNPSFHQMAPRRAENGPPAVANSTDPPQIVPRSISFQSRACVAELEHQALGEAAEIDGIGVRNKVKGLGHESWWELVVMVAGCHWLPLVFRLCWEDLPCRKSSLAKGKPELSNCLHLYFGKRFLQRFSLAPSLGFNDKFPHRPTKS